VAKGFDDFGARMSKRAEKITRGIERRVRGAALVIDQVLVMSTPVDTGRARANWITSLGAPEFREVENPGSGQAHATALAQGKTVVARWRVGGGPIFISNSVPYITFLDDGSSAQAPEGMTAQAIAAGAAYLRREAEGR
jgi:hypothetical protein